MLLFFILFVPLFVLILLGVHMLVATSNPDPAKIAPYECGFSSFSDARQKFQISFFLVAILFLVFDCEILFLYPLVVSLYHVSFLGFWIAMIFILLLTVGFIYELGIGVLDYAKSPSSSSSQKTPQPLPKGVRFYSTSSSPNDPSKFTSDSKRKRDKGNIKYTFQYRINQTLTPFQAEVLIGLLLGDACIQATVSKIGGHRLTIRHSMEQYEYLQHLHELFEDLVVQSLALGKTLDNRTKETYFWCNLHTLSFKCFAYYRKFFYSETGVKIVPANIGELLTPVGLAYWLCDDGHFQKAGGGVYFCTDSFSLVEVELLVSVLKKHFNLVGNIHSISNKKYNRIYLGISEMDTFRALVTPHLHPSMLYKLGF